MQFTTRKRRNPPSVIIVSLIDVLIVVLIFLMVASTFKQHPSIKLALPESKQASEPTSTEGNLVVTIAKSEPHLFLGRNPVTLDRLEAELKASVRRNPGVRLAIRQQEDGKRKQACPMPSEVRPVLFHSQ